MKNIIYPLILVFFTLAASAQNAFPTENASWKMMYDLLQGPQSTKELIHFSYGSDSLVLNNETYFRLEQITGTGPIAWYYMSYDTISKKVKLLESVSDTTPEILYDFSMDIGDTLKLAEFGNETNTLKWYVTDTITFNTGSDIRDALLVKLNYFGVVFQDTLVEGIGSVHGLFTPMFEPPYAFQFGYQLVCFTDSNTGFQFEPDFFKDSTFSCASRMSLPEELLNEPLTLETFPSPFDNQLTLYNNSSQNLEVSIATMVGKPLVNFSLPPGEERIINTSNWSSSVYIVQALSESSVVSSKVIKR